MSDIQVMKIVDVVDGAPVSDTTQSGQRVVRYQILGLAESVAEVTVGGYIVSYSVAGARLLDVSIPPVFSSVQASDLATTILSSGRTFDANVYEILYDVGTTTEAVSGNDYLIQKFLRFLLMSPGTDKKDISAGAGLMRMSGRITPSNLETTRPLVARAFDSAKNQVISRQSSYRSRLRGTEILRDATLTRVALDGDVTLVVEGLLIDGSGSPITVGTRL